MGDIISNIKEKINVGDMISFEEAKELVEIKDSEKLYELANAIKKENFGNKIELCSIINAKSGLCSEKCKYCAQSVHYNTDVKKYPLLNQDEILKTAKENEKKGVHCFSIVTSGNKLTTEEFKEIYQTFAILKKETNLTICASLGSISYAEAFTLKQIGVSRYHHNVETSKSFYPEICETHCYSDRIKTIKNVLNAGLEVCSGGIIGMGESMEQRIEMAIELRELGINLIPINILTPIKGTPLENSKKLSIDEILRTMAIFRVINPNSVIRYAAGRTTLGGDQFKGFFAGVNAVMVGDYLTTSGNNIIDDMDKLKELGFEV